MNYLSVSKNFKYLFFSRQNFSLKCRYYCQTQINQYNNSLVKSYNPPRYYLKNFFIVLDSVLQDHNHLFLDNELSILNIFKSELSENEQRTYIRLYHRKGPWFKLSMLEKNYEKEVRTALPIIKDKKENL